MYEKHFGLKSRPFGSKADGASVFVGPQQSKTIASLQKGLAAADAVVTVTGQVGGGKTTIVNRALETLPTGRTAARIGRMHLSPQEVIDLLMAGFGIKQSHQGSIRRFAAFRRLLQAQSESGIPVAIVIEDAHRLGVEALAEVEALTAADGGDAAAANIILMGQPGLHDLLSTPDLARLKQRVRLRQEIAPLSLAEVRGYLKHSIREAGGDYDAVFDSGVAEIIHGCSEGIPRMINTLCETALTTAMEDHSARVTATVMRQVALEAFGYEGCTDDVRTAPVPLSETAARVESPPVADVAASANEDIDWEAPPQRVEAEAPADEKDNEASDESGIGHDMIVESGSYPSAAEILAGEPVNPAESSVLEVTVEDTNLHAIPELINDTQPELPELREPVFDDSVDIPVLSPITDVADESPTPDIDDEADIESTQTLAQPVGLSIDEAIGPAPDEESAGPDETLEAEASTEDFDLDAALSPDVDETNVMPGITPNLDDLASEGRQVEAATSNHSVQTPAPDPVKKAAVPEAKPVTEPVATAANAETLKVAEPKSGAEPVTAAISDNFDLPTLSSSMRADVEKGVAGAKTSAPEATVPPDLPIASDTASNAPAMRDVSTLTSDADRKSDIDALEAALAAAKSGSLAEQNAIPAMPRVNGAAPELSVDDEAAPLPEITLDKVIADQQIQNDQLDRFRAEIGKASSLEDISDFMAETLFGCEAFDEIAADVVANPPADYGLASGEVAPSPVKLTDEEMPTAANDAAELNIRKPLPARSPGTTSEENSDVPLNESTALRIEMLNKMKTRAASMAENVELGEENPADRARHARGPQPEPIERQINTSITQTLEALKISKVTESVEGQKPEKKSGGLFSRFKKSS
jgi:type II secretory pathway predicted ATPase ExeA